MTALAAPDRSLAQRIEALQHANDTRHDRMVLKRQIKAGNVSAVDVLANPPAFMLTMRAYDLLLAVPKVGRVKANMIVARCQISPSKTIGGLSPRQLVALCAAIKTRGLR